MTDEYYQRGHSIGTSLAINSTKGVWAALRGDKKFPRKLDYKKTVAVVRDLERDGYLVKGTFKNEQARKWDECWQVAPEPTYTAPSTDAEVAQGGAK